MAVTFAQWAIDNRAKVGAQAQALIMTLDQISPIFRLLPQEKINGAYYEYEQTNTLPSVSWRALNQAYSESTGTTVPFREYMKIMGGEAKVDVALEAWNQNPTSPMAKQVKLKLQAAANEWERAFLEGSELSSPNEMVGLRARIAATSQLIIQAAGGGTLTLAKLDALIDSVPFVPRGGNGLGQVKRGEGIRKALITNRTLYAKINTLITAATGSRQIQTTRDEFGNYLEMYRDSEIIVVEQTGTTTTTLGFDEDPGDGVSDTASIYCVAFGEGLVHGFFNNGVDSDGFPILMQVQQYGRPGGLGTEAEPRNMTRFETRPGIAIDHPRAASRLYGITNT